MISKNNRLRDTFTGTANLHIFDGATCIEIGEIVVCFPGKNFKWNLGMSYDEYLRNKVAWFLMIHFPLVSCAMYAFYTREQNKAFFDAEFQVTTIVRKY